MFVILIVWALALFLLPIPSSQVSTRSLTDKVAKRNFPGLSFRKQAERAEPEIAADIVDTSTHPNQHDHVATAINDALQLVMVAWDQIDNDNTIFPNYFARRDRSKVKAVFGNIIGICQTGNVMLSKLLIQTTDYTNSCNDDTLAFTEDEDTDSPFIVLCPRAFRKKAFTTLMGAPDPKNDPERYLRCDELTANGHVSYLMNSLGATLLHEYMHYDMLMLPVYNKPIIDQQLNEDQWAYGPWTVYNNLNKALLVRLNADSYTYYALETFFTHVCGTRFAAPREGIDDDDSNTMDIKCCQTKRADSLAVAG
ncbi:MAG: hypothetical protein Q9222_000798 [Ikaeria aurantiellina]